MPHEPAGFPHPLGSAPPAPPPAGGRDDSSDARWAIEWAPPTAARPGANGLDSHPFAGKAVLVVDDDFRNAFALTALLERGRAEIAVAESGSAAIQMLEQRRRTDIVLMDIMMPVMDGYETMRVIRSKERFATLPLIAVTGKDAQGERQRCLDAGANDYLAKPVVTAQLLSVIGPWLTNASSNSQ
jgi:CheY-like chemotaxis protein